MRISKRSQSFTRRKHKKVFEVVRWVIIFILNMRVQNWKTSSFLTVTSVKRQEQKLYLDFFITKNLVLNKQKFW